MVEIRSLKNDLAFGMKKEEEVLPLIQQTSLRHTLYNNIHQ